MKVWIDESSVIPDPQIKYVVQQVYPELYIGRDMLRYAMRVTYVGPMYVPDNSPYKYMVLQLPTLYSGYTPVFVSLLPLHVYQNINSKSLN